MSTPGSSTGVNSSGSTCFLQNYSGSEQENQRKRKRMLSNRESARRSRMRKQKHLDDLVIQVAELMKDNTEILTSVNITTQLHSNLEAENSVLRAQMSELSNRLQSLNDIIDFINSSTLLNLDDQIEDATQSQINDISVDFGFMINNPWDSSSLLLHVNQPIIASAPDDMFLY